MSSGNLKLAEQVKRLPLDDSLNAAVLDGVANTDAETANSEAESLKGFLDSLPDTLEAVREAVARDRRRQANRHGEEILIELMEGVIEPHTSALYATTVDTHACLHCGRTSTAGIEQFLVRLGITDDMINNLQGQFQNVDIDEYLDTARAYLKDGSFKVTDYAKENPGKVAAGVAAIALGAGLIYAAMDRDRE